MTRSEEITTELEQLRDALLTDLEPEDKVSVQGLIAQLEAEQASLGGSSSAMPQTGMAQAALATLRATMLSSAGTGIDSKEVRQMIEDYLKTEKVNLAELDNDVLEEIKKNQKVILELPNFGGLKIEVTKKDSEIPYFYEVIDDVLAGNNVYLIGEAGGGKAQRLSSKILVENGWTTFGEIKVGDKVWGQDGKLYEVDGVFDRGVKPVYGVTVNDGGYTECCDEHLWKIYTSSDRGHKNNGRVVPLSSFKDELKTISGRSNAFIDVAKAVNFNDVKHTIDPYLLGVILGDGSITQKSVTVTNPSQELFDSLQLPEGVELCERFNEDRCLTYGITRIDNSKPNPLTTELKRMGLMGKSALLKFIPNEYLIDSIENRIALLQGLNDTDAYCDETHFEYSTSSERLANDYAELVRSLGGTAKIASRTPYYTYNGVKKEGNLSFRIYCVFPDNVEPFKLEYKKSRYSKPTKYFTKRFITSVEYIKDEEVRCISVTNPEHLYITDDYIVTHNTYTAEQVAQKLKREFSVINCSQYTSPTEILGGQTIEGYKEGKLIDAWRKGKILILDEMPRLDPNTAGLFNDALAKSSKTREAKNALISSTNPEEPPIERNPNFGLIATGNIYPNTLPPPKYKANNQQDLSLLDRFSGSVYKIEYSKSIDENNSRFKFLYDMLIGNYYDYIGAIKNKQAPPQARGLRTVLKDLNQDELAVVSYRTLISFRIAFEFELVRAVAKNNGSNVSPKQGKTLQKAFDSFLVAFDSTTADLIIRTTQFTPAFIESKVQECIDLIIKGDMILTLNESVAKQTSSIFKKYADFFAPETFEPKP